MIEFRARIRPAIGLDMTPMIDCVFQLLIFFLLSSSFLTPAVKLSLPRASADKPDPTAPIVVSVNRVNQLFVNKAQIDRESLRPRLKALFEQTKQKVVVLRADKGLPYEKVLEILVLVQQAGATQVRLAYEGEEGQR